MAVATVLACTGCALQSPLVLSAGLYVGGVIMFFGLLRPYVHQVRRVWGIPRYRMTDVISLGMLLAWPIAFGRLSLASYSPERVIMCSLGLMACTVFLWLRGLWLLEQFGVHRLTRRTAFLGVLVPATFLAGLVVGYGLVSSLVLLLGIGFFGPSVIVGVFVGLAVTSALGVLIGMPIQFGLKLVFKPEETTRPTPANHPV